MGPVLRSWLPSDAGALLSARRSTSDLDNQFAGPINTESEAAEYITQHLVITDTQQIRAIVNNNIAVGQVALSNIDSKHQTAWASYWLAKPARGFGFAARGLVAASNWAFSSGIFRIELGYRVNNPASCRVATLAGFPVEGIERQKLQYNDIRYDVELHARLKTDPPPKIMPLFIIDN